MALLMTVLFWPRCDMLVTEIPPFPWSSVGYFHENGTNIESYQKSDIDAIWNFPHLLIRLWRP